MKLPQPEKKADKDIKNLSELEILKMKYPLNRNSATLPPQAKKP